MQQDKQWEDPRRGDTRWEDPRQGDPGRGDKRRAEKRKGQQQPGHAFPLLLLTALTFVLFLVAYWFVTQRAIQPHYVDGLWYAAPCVCFAILAWVTRKNYITTMEAIAVSSAVLVTSAALLFFFSLHIMIEESTTVITDTAYYDRVIQSLERAPGQLGQYFPDEIPQEAENVQFFYRPPFIQGGGTVALKFDAQPEQMRGYVDQLTHTAVWRGKATDTKAGQFGISDSTFRLSQMQYELPADNTIYVLFSRSSPQGDWHHGTQTLATINQEETEILFLIQQW